MLLSNFGLILFAPRSINHGDLSPLQLFESQSCECLLRYLPRDAIASLLTSIIRKSKILCFSWFFYNFDKIICAHMLVFVKHPRPSQQTHSNKRVDN